MVKKVIIVVLALVLSFTLVFGVWACAKPAPAPAPAPAPKPAPAVPSDLAIGTKFMPSTTYVWGVSVTKVLNKHVEGITVHVGSYATDSYFADAFAKGLLQIGIGSTHTTVQQVYGMGKWEGRGSAPMRVMTTGPRWYLGVIARPGAGITTPADLKGKKWMIILRGSALLRDMADATLHGYGLTEKDVTLVEYSSSKEIVAAMKEGRVDAAGFPYQAGSPWLEELVMAGKADLISDTPEALDKITKAYPMFSRGALPAGSYKGQDKDVNTYTSVVTLDVHADLPADLVYDMVTALYENFEEWSNYHTAIKHFAMPGGIDVSRMGIPVHEGAIKYYKEKGYWTAAHEAKQKELIERLKGLGPYVLK